LADQLDVLSGCYYIDEPRCRRKNEPLDEETLKGGSARGFECPQEYGEAHSESERELQ
jgi:hypothetical protein